MAEDGGFKQRLTLSQFDKPLAAAFPPSPPIGQLPPEELWPTWSNGSALSGEKLKEHLYELTLTRWGLRREDAFNNTVPFMRGPQRSDAMPEEYAVRVLILALEGKTDMEIAGFMEKDRKGWQQKTVSNDPNLERLIIQGIRSRYFAPHVKEIVRDIKNKSEKIQRLIYPIIDPATGKETLTSTRIEEMRKALGFEHRSQLWNLASRELPSHDGIKFNRLDTVVEALYRNIVLKEPIEKIEADIAKEYERTSKLVVRLRNVLLSKEAKERTSFETRSRGLLAAKEKQKPKRRKR